MQEARKDKTIPLIAFLVVEIIIVIILISLITIFKKDDKIGNIEYDRQPSTTIENLASKLPDDPKEYVNAVQRELANTIELNTESFDLSGTKAEIRQDTLKVQQFNRLEGYYFSVIVDIPNLQQSYQIYAHYPAKNSPPNSTPPNTMYVLCLNDQNEIIYPNFQCEDNHSSDIRLDLASYYLRYFDFNYFSAFLDDSLTKVNINPTEYSPTESEKEFYLEETRNAIESLGISPGLFTYEIIVPQDLNYYISPEDR